MFPLTPNTTIVSPLTTGRENLIDGDGITPAPLPKGQSFADWFVHGAIVKQPSHFVTENPESVAGAVDPTSREQADELEQATQETPPEPPKPITPSTDTLLPEQNDDDPPIQAWVPHPLSRPEPAKIAPPLGTNGASQSLNDLPLAAPVRLNTKTETTAPANEDAATLLRTVPTRHHANGIEAAFVARLAPEQPMLGTPAKIPFAPQSRDMPTPEQSPTLATASAPIAPQNTTGIAFEITNQMAQPILKIETNKAKFSPTPNREQVMMPSVPRDAPTLGHIPVQAEPPTQDPRTPLAPTSGTGQSAPNAPSLPLTALPEAEDKSPAPSAQLAQIDPSQRNGSTPLYSVFRAPEPYAPIRTSQVAPLPKDPRPRPEFMPLATAMNTTPPKANASDDRALGAVQTITPPPNNTESDAVIQPKTDPIMPVAMIRDDTGQGVIKPDAPIPHDRPTILRHIAQQIAPQISSTQVSQSSQTTELVLSPEELGRVRIHMSQVDTGLTLAITSERPETLDLMRRHIDQLTQEFRSLGFTNLKFDFAQGGSSGFAQNGNRPGTESGGHTAKTATEVPHPPQQNQAASGGLDLRL